MERKDYYSVLGIVREAGDDEIKRAYRKLAIHYHPDTNQGIPDAEEKIKEINEAYSVLSDPEKRMRYDFLGQADFDGAFMYTTHAPSGFPHINPLFGKGRFCQGRGKGRGRGMGRGRGRKKFI